VKLTIIVLGIVLVLFGVWRKADDLYNEIVASV